MQTKESSQGSQATQNGYRVERAGLIGARRSGGAGLAEARAAVGTRGVASLSGCSGADRGIGERSVVGMGAKKGRMKERGYRGRRTRDIGRESISLVREIAAYRKGHSTRYRGRGHGCRIRNRTREVKRHGAGIGLSAPT